MKIAGSDITFIDFPTVDDWAVIIYFAGCSNNCVNCQNKELQNPDYKSSILSIQDEENLFNFIKDICKKQDTNKIVFSGGDPLYPTNREIIKNFLNKYGSLYDICIYTGYSIDDVKKFVNTIETIEKTPLQHMPMYKALIEMQDNIKSRYLNPMYFELDDINLNPVTGIQSILNANPYAFYTVSKTGDRVFDFDKFNHFSSNSFALFSIFSKFKSMPSSCAVSVA